MLQSDHTRYLLTHRRPPTLLKRACVHLLVPMAIFVFAGWCSGNIRNDYVNSVVCTALVYLVVVWIVSGCLRGRKKRVMVREEALWRLKRRDDRMTNANGGGNDDNNNNNNNHRASGGGRPGLEATASSERGRRIDGATTAEGAEDAEYDADGSSFEVYQYYSEDEWEYQQKYDGTLGQTRCEMNCAHRTNRVLPVGRRDGAPDDDDHDHDRPDDDDVDDDYDDDDGGGDACTRTWRVLARPCLPCLPLCNGSRGFHLQCCGLCALAQEAREANITLPRHLRMIDYVTMEPFVTYYPRILELRTTSTRGLWEHVAALSELSKLLLVSFKSILVALLIVSFSDLVGYWNPADVYVLAGTFLQSFAVAYCVHWGWHRYDLSVDAVIKYFATGLVLCTSMAFAAELFGYLLFALAVMVVTGVLNVREVQDNGYGDAGGIHVMTDEWKGGSRYLKFFGLGNEDHVGHGRSLTAGSDILGTDSSMPASCCEDIARP
ncbi:LOW QUALITY PROTEIN: hypothetical protein ACHAW5_001207 [Stephanodiscus triporus]|uniref:Transmembrane protein 163 n=1 Tax=Stephanodiscus triporus TaxID=2934178 RepID=A0ABD3N556_9STRA